MRTLTRARRRSTGAVAGRHGSWVARGDGGYRAVTLGDRTDDWAVLNERGDVVYRGYMLFAARVASRLNAA